MILESAILGTLCALDLFLFYVFWELMLIPLYFMIGVWGGKRRIISSRASPSMLPTAKVRGP